MKFNFEEYRKININNYLSRDEKKYLTNKQLELFYYKQAEYLNIHKDIILKYFINSESIDEFLQKTDIETLIFCIKLLNIELTPELSKKIIIDNIEIADILLLLN